MNRKAPNTENTENAKHPSSFKLAHIHSLTHERMKDGQKLTHSFQSSFPVIGRHSSFVRAE